MEDEGLKTSTTFQAYFIEAQSDLQERQQTSLQGGYGYNNLFVTEEAFTNIAQAKSEEREEVNNLTGTNINLTIHMYE